MTGGEPQPIRHSPGQGLTVDNPLGGALTFKALGDQTREVVYVIEGTLRLRLGDETQPAPAGAFAYIPRGLPHTWQNIGGSPARFLAIFTPAAPGMESFFDRFAELIDEMPLTDAFQALGAAAGMRVLGPPLGESENP